jgi:KAP family P-loop domain.
MGKFVVLNKNSNKIKIPFNLEFPFVKITKITIPALNPHNIEALRYTIGCAVIDILKSSIQNKTAPPEVLFNGTKYLYDSTFQYIFEVNKTIIIDNDFDKIELIYDNISDEDLEIHVHYEIVNNNVSLTNPFENFKSHIETSDNIKILFSAPFGQGKTTFLNYFFEEQHKDKYEVFKVFPVNYSISHNEDVFKYIKAEILFKLLETDVTFDKESFSYFQTAPQFFNSDPIRVFSALVPLIPKIGKSTFEILDPLYKLVKEYFDYHNEMKTDDEKSAKSFIEELYKKEGSIFEDNFYTQLIRQLLERLKTITSKDNVLIIEDLDRMDPDHIFRILNIFTAHFDAPDKDDGSTNKFGFDKIIIVGDYNNIKHTFAYRYGDKVDFGGYINKYYSSSPFYYDNKSAITEFCWTLRNDKDFNQENTPLDVLSCVLSDLIDSDCVTLRDLIKLKKWNAKEVLSGKFITSPKHSKHLYNSFLYFNLFLYLSNSFDISSLIQKFNVCKGKSDANTKWKYDYYTRIGLPSLIFNGRFGIAGELSFKQQNIAFGISEDRYGDFYYATNPLDIDSKLIQFNKSDFYEMLILNAEKYDYVGGFK